VEWISVISMVATTVSAAAAFATACMAKRSNDRSLQNIEDAKYADFVMWEADWNIDENSGKGFVLFANVGDSPAKKVHATIRGPLSSPVGSLLDSNVHYGVIDEVFQGSNSEIAFELDMEYLRNRGEQPTGEFAMDGTPVKDHKAHYHLRLYIYWEDSGGKRSQRLVSPEIN